MKAIQTKATTSKNPSTDDVNPPAAAGQARPHIITDSGDTATLRRDVKVYFGNIARESRAILCSATLALGPAARARPWLAGPRG
jgi:hypothetical protein